MNVRFEISVNGQPIATTGCAGYGVLSAGLDWVLRDPARFRPDPHDEAYTIDDWGKETLCLHAGGLDSERADDETHLMWVNQELRVGDEVRVRILPAGEFDEPASEPFPPVPPAGRPEE